MNLLFDTSQVTILFLTFDPVSVVDTVSVDTVSAVSVHFCLAQEVIIISSSIIDQLSIKLDHRSSSSIDHQLIKTSIQGLTKGLQTPPSPFLMSSHRFVFSFYIALLAYRPSIWSLLPSHCRLSHATLFLPSPLPCSSVS